MLEEQDFSQFVCAKICGLKNCRFWYGIKKNLEKIFDFGLIKPGTILKVPLKNLVRFALVDNLSNQPFEAGKFEIKEVCDVAFHCRDSFFYEFVSRVAKIYLIEEADLYSSLIDLLSCFPKNNGQIKNQNNDEQHIFEQICLSNLSMPGVGKEINLTDEQRLAVDAIGRKIDQGGFEQFLLYGVTGSGKTEVYRRLILKAAKNGRSSIFLLPEIGLCQRFYSIFSDLSSYGIKVLCYHSAIQRSQKRDVIDAINSDRPVLIIGVHLPVFLPIPNLGLILVDEEHEQGFCRKNSPKIDSKRMAILRAKIYKIPIVLGSATPSVDLIKAMQDKIVSAFRLTKRLSKSSRQVKVVSLTKKERRINFWITKELESEIEARLERGEQSIIFINRRGHSFSAQCKDCGLVVDCPNCSVSLTVHKEGSTGATVLCHYCGFRSECQKNCKKCGSAQGLIFKGVGTQKIAAVLADRFPKARIVRVDLDSSKNKKAWPEVLKEVLAGKVDILVGTQSIAKGYHFPNVTLIGVIWADLDFNFPSYDAQEVAVQRLLQISGRTGRGERSGLVLFQAMQDLKILDGLDESKYETFCQKELEMRQMAQFPPFYKLYQIQILGKDGSVVEHEAVEMSKKISELAKELGFFDMSLIGPFKPPIYKVDGVEIRELLVKGGCFSKIGKVLSKMNFDAFSSKVHFKLLF